ncbi:hypothetical protein [Bradyrhizobium sp. P5_C12]
MTKNTVLVDYTTLVSAANVICCADAIYPSSTKNPYRSLLAGQPTHPDSPMWLEVASLADLVEGIVIHETLCVLDVADGDRNRELGRYVKDGSRQRNMMSFLRAESILEELDVASGDSINFQNWIQEAAKSGALLTSLINALFELLKQPAYRGLPDLFSHSQTVYKFDGETVWSRVQGLVDPKELSRAFRRKLRENANSIQLAETSHFYPEDILGYFLRGLYYNDVAKVRRIPYHPHGGRSPIVMSDGLWAAGVVENYASLPVQFVQRLRHEIAGDVNSVASCNLFDLDLPPVLGAVLREANKPEDCIPIAVQMRNTPAAVQYRKCLQSISAPDSGLKVLRLKADLDELKQNLRKQLLLERQTVSFSLWKFSFPIKIPGWLFKSFYSPGQMHMQFIRDLALSSIGLRSLESRLIQIFRHN